MFDGEIICKSEVGKGTNFIFIVSLTDDEIIEGQDSSNNRFMNPIQKEYEKIRIPEKFTCNQSNEHTVTNSPLNLNEVLLAIQEEN